MMLRIIWLISIMSPWFSFAYSAQRMRSIPEEFDRDLLIKIAGRALIKGLVVPKLCRDKEFYEIESKDFYRVYESTIKFFVFMVLKNQNPKVQALAHEDSAFIDKVLKDERWLKHLLSPSIFLNIMALIVVFSKRCIYMQAFGDLRIGEKDIKQLSVRDILSSVTLVNVEKFSADLLSAEGEDEAWIIKKDKRKLQQIILKELTEFFKSQFYYVSCDLGSLFLSNLVDTYVPISLIKKNSLPMVIVLEKNKALANCSFEEDLRGNVDWEDVADEIERTITEKKPKAGFEAKQVMVQRLPRIPEVAQRAVADRVQVRGMQIPSQSSGHGALDLLAQVFFGTY